MNIDHVIISCDDNGDYLKFWPLVSQAWVDLAGIRPTMLYLGSRDVAELANPAQCPIVKLDLPVIAHAYFRAGFVRFWWAANHLGDSTGLVWDVDLFPLSGSWWKREAAKLPVGKFGHIHASRAKRDWLLASGCLATGNTFRDVLELTPDWEGDCRRLLAVESKINWPVGKMPLESHFGLDEAWAAFMAMRIHPDRFVINECKGEPPAWFVHRSTDIPDQHLRSEQCIMCHAPRDFDAHESQLRSLLQRAVKYERARQSNPTPCCNGACSCR